MSSIGGWLAFNLYINAALRDANVQQREDLICALRPLVEELRHDKDAATGMIEVVIRFMGVDWRPTRQDWQFIAALLKKEDGANGRERAGEAG